MERRTFLRAGAGTAAATVALVGAGAGISAARDVDDDPEEQHWAGMGTGATDLVWSVPTSRRAVALTFDDGPHPDLTPAIADLLEARGLRATFFVIGAMAEQHPALVRRLRAAGHEIGNHTRSHLSLAHATGAEARAEVLAGAAAVERVTGGRPRWFRPPRGMLNGAVLRAAADAGQHVAMWTSMPAARWLDDPADAIRRLGDAAEPGGIFLFHDGTSGRDDAALLERRHRELPVLDGLLDRLAADGYELLTLTDLAASSAPTA